MFRVRASAVLGAVLGFVMLTPAFTNAREIELSVENRIGGDSNVFRRSGARNEDGFYELAPRVIVREERRELNYDLRYLPVYQTFLGVGGVDGFDHTAVGRLEWNVTPRDTIGMTQRFMYTRTLRLEDVTGTTSDAPILEESDRQRIRRLNAEAYYSRQFTPTLGGRVSVDFSDIDFNSEFNVDTRAFGGSLSGNIILNERSQVGLFASTRYRENRGVGLQNSSTAIIGNIAATFFHQFPEQISFSVQVGPSLIRTEEDDLPGVTIAPFEIFTIGGTTVARAIDTAGPGGACNARNLDLLRACPLVAVPSTTTLPANAPVTLAAPRDGRGETNTDVSYFAEIRLVKQWERSSAEFGYTRSESANAGNSSSSIVDSVSIALRWRPLQKTTVSLNGEWSHREFIADLRQSVVTVAPDAAIGGGSGFFFARATSVQSLVIDSNSSDQTLWRASLYVQQRLTEKLTVIGLTSFTRTNRGSSGRDSRIDVVRGYVGLRYVFDPVVF